MLVEMGVMDHITKPNCHKPMRNSSYFYFYYQLCKYSMKNVPRDYKKKITLLITIAFGLARDKSCATVRKQLL